MTTGDSGIKQVRRQKQNIWLIVISLIAVLGVVAFIVSTVNREEDVWKLTQYPDDSGNQAMFYALTNKGTGNLILIDGGWGNNAERVSQVIDENHGHVTAWFLTHYHKDHCEAFNALWDKYKDKIDVVYVTPLVWEEFEATAKDWDTPETFSTFLEQTQGSEKIKALNREDQLEVAGLKVSVFNAYDDVVRKYSDIANNCSLVFKISAAKQSVLFLGDAYNNALGKDILEQFGAEALQADYVQAAHHGNNTQSHEFYLAVSPSVIFLDGPEWLMTGENYDAKDLLAWCAEQGITTYDYRQAPTMLILE